MESDRAGKGVQTYRELLIWQKGMEIAKSIYAVTKSWPKEELYGLTQQIRRCSVSTPSNIAEGFGRRARLDFAKFLRVSLGSLYEMQTQLELAKEFGYVKEKEYVKIVETSNELEKMTNSLIKTLILKNKEV